MRDETYSWPQRALNAAATMAASICLAITFVAAGFAVCAAVPQTTEILANAVSGTDNPQTPFSHDDLVQAALVTRDYTVGSNNRDAVFAMLHTINANADTRYAEATQAQLAQAPDPYTLTEEALSHLDDVHHVVAAAYPVLLVIALVAIAAAAHVGVRMGRRALGGVGIAAGVVTLSIFGLMGVWAAFDFNGFFAAFHSLFFADGTWTFTWDSLLITMYPTAFWVGMGALWLAVTCLLSLISIIVGALLRRKRV